MIVGKYYKDKEEEERRRREMQREYDDMRAAARRDGGESSSPVSKDSDEMNKRRADPPMTNVVSSRTEYYLQRTFRPTGQKREHDVVHSDRRHDEARLPEEGARGRRTDTGQCAPNGRTQLMRDVMGERTLNSWY